MGNNNALQTDCLEDVEKWAMDQEGLNKKHILDVADGDMPEYLALRIQKKRKNVRYALYSGILNLIATVFVFLSLYYHSDNGFGILGGIWISCFFIAALIFLSEGIPGRLNFKKYAAKEFLLLKYSKECLELRKKVRTADNQVLAEERA